MIIHDNYLQSEKRKKKINMVFIPPNENKQDPKPFCYICKRYMVYIRDQGYECPICGNEYKEVKSDGDKLASIRDSKPRIYSKKSTKNKRSADFPPNATIKEDTEYPAGTF